MSGVAGTLFEFSEAEALLQISFWSFTTGGHAGDFEDGAGFLELFKRGGRRFWI